MPEPAASDHPVLTDLSDGVATITLNSPANRNALSAELVNGLGEGLQRFDADPAARVIVLTNSGPAFCAGADLKGASGVQPLFGMPDLFRIIQSSATPVIGRIAGHCTGGGVGLAAVCDISVMDEDAKLGFTEVRLGVAPAMISVVCLPKMRRGDAMELFLSGEKISGARAAEVGLVNRAVPADALDDAVAEIVGKLARGGPTALALAKSLVFDVPGMDADHALTEMAAVSARQFASDEAREGILAFRERRDASWVPGAE